MVQELPHVEVDGNQTPLSVSRNLKGEGEDVGWFVIFFYGKHPRFFEEGDL